MRCLNSQGSRKEEVELGSAEQNQNMDFEADRNPRYDTAIQVARARRITVANVFVVRTFENLIVIGPLRHGQINPYLSHSIF